MPTGSSSRTRQPARRCNWRRRCRPSAAASSRSSTNYEMGHTRRRPRMAREQFDLIVFDWDGTLVDSTAHITRSIQAACRDLGSPVPAAEAASSAFGLGRRAALQIAAPSLDPVEYPRLAEFYRFHYLVKDQTT